jgi:hypothetical protein
MNQFRIATKSGCPILTAFFAVRMGNLNPQSVLLSRSGNSPDCSFLTTRIRKFIVGEARYLSLFVRFSAGLGLC